MPKVPVPWYSTRVPDLRRASTLLFITAGGAIPSSSPTTTNVEARRRSNPSARYTPSRRLKAWERTASVLATPCDPLRRPSSRQPNSPTANSQRRRHRASRHPQCRTRPRPVLGRHRAAQPGPVLQHERVVPLPADRFRVGKPSWTEPTYENPPRSDHRERRTGASAKEEEPRLPFAGCCCRCASE